MPRSSALLTLLWLVHGCCECEPWCTEPCTVLNGNVQLECDSCKPEAAECYPGASGYDTWNERHEEYHGGHGDALEGPSDPEDAAIMALAPGCTTLRCNRVREKRRLELQQRRLQAAGGADAAAAEAARQQRAARCSDTDDQCTRWAADGECAANPKYMLSACRRSCGMCDDDDDDDDDVQTAAIDSYRRGGAPGGRIGLGPRHDGKSAGGEEVACELQRVSKAELDRMAPSERKELFEYPTVITGLIDTWPALHGWASPRNFTRRYGHHRVLAKRTSFGWQRAEEEGRDRERTTVSVAELVQRTHTEHIIVLDEYELSMSEDQLLEDLMSEADGYTNPDIFDSASQCRVFSFGGGHRGVQVMQHGVAWLGLVSGAKLWHLAPPHLPKPSDRTCDNGGRIDHALAKREGMTHCLMLPGETIFVPERWWHATCNLDPYTIGVGGQLWRPGMEKVFEKEGERTVPVVMRESYPASRLIRDTPLADKVPTIVFDPARAEGDDEEEVGGGVLDDYDGEAGIRVGIDAAGGGMRMGMGGGMGATRPREVHAWKDREGGANALPLDASSQPDLMGAPRDDGRFAFPGGYKKDGCDLWVVDAPDVTRELLEAAPSPFLIRGLTANWSALEDWKPGNILRAHGDAPFHLHAEYNKSLAELLAWQGKYHMGHSVYPRRTCYSDPWRPYTPFLFGQLASTYHLPEYFHPMSTFQMGIGFGHGVGVPPENHPSSWFALVVGRKRWMLHPDTETEPPEIMPKSGRSMCMPRPRLKRPSTLECTQLPGEVLWVPNYWWHETCGLDEFSAGIGGITYKGCCDDIERGTPSEVDCTDGTWGPGTNYGLDNIPHCQEGRKNCGSQSGAYPMQYRGE